MNEEHVNNAAQERDSEQEPAERIDMERPFFVVIDQTEKRTFTKIFQAGPAPDSVRAIAIASTEAHAYAKSRAWDTGRRCAVIGPQGAVYEKPEIIDAKRVPLPFTMLASVSSAEQGES